MRHPAHLPFLLALAATPLLADKELKPIIVRIQPKTAWTLTLPAEGNAVLRGARLDDVTSVKEKPIQAQGAGAEFRLPLTWTLPKAADERSPAFVRLYLKVADEKDKVMVSLVLSDKNQLSRLFLLATGGGSKAWAATGGALAGPDGKALDVTGADEVAGSADAGSAGAPLIIFASEFPRKR